MTRPRPPLLLLATLGIILASLPTSAVAQDDEPLACMESDLEMDKYRYARSLSLDLRGTLPDVTSELEPLHELEDVPEDWIDTWMDSDAFAGQITRLHRRLLQNNIEDATRLIHFERNMTRTRYDEGEERVYVYWRNSRDLTENLRGSRIGCLNQPQTEFGPNGEVIPIIEEFDASGELVERREGWVEVAPYWDPDNPIRVCAYDAQTNLVSPLTGRRCDRNASNDDGYCGCGPELQWCLYGDVRRDILQSMADDVEQRIHQLVREQRPYTELFDSQTAYVNGPIVHFWKHLSQFPQNLSVHPATLSVERLPDIPYTDEGWYPVQLDGTHAGVLTSIPYLLRFQTNRARANRFFTLFLCSPFQAPPGGIPVSSERSALEPDLQKRDGCKYCHALVEPAAAYWGRWAETGAGYITPEEYPAYDADCALCASGNAQCSDRCRDHYITRALDVREQPYLGMLKPYSFLYEEHESHVEEGPRSLAMDTVVDNRLLSCTANTAAEHFLGRPLEASELTWRDDLVREFVKSGYNYRTLVKEIVTSPMYRRVP